MQENLLTQSPAKNKVDVLNVIRVVATLIVFFLHGRGYILGIENTSGFFQAITCLPAWAGVWMLFYLSGYLMQKGFDDKRYKVFGTERPAKEYFSFCLKRFLKIAPVYYTYILLFLILNKSTFIVDSPVVFIQMLTFSFNGNGGIGGLGHLWYISPAMWFYILAPLFSLIIEKTKHLAKGKFNIILFFIVTIVGVGLRLVFSLVFNLSWYTWIYTFLPLNIDLFFGGMLACSIVTSNKNCLCGKKKIAYKVLSSLLFATLIYVNSYLYSIDRNSLYQYGFPTFYLMSLAFLCYSFDNETVVYAKPSLENIKKNPLRIIDWFSGKTFEFYVFHIMVFGFIENCLIYLGAYENVGAVGLYFIFFSLCFIFTLLVAVVFNKMMSGFKKKKKQTA